MMPKDSRATGQGREEPDVLIEHADVEVHEAPVEIHEHVEVRDAGEGAPGAPPMAAGTLVRIEPVDEAAEERERRQELRWHEHVLARRSLRFGTAGLLLAVTTIVASLWFVNGVLRAEGYFGALAPDAALAGLGLALLLGFVLAWGAGDGMVLAMVLGWLAALAVMALAAYQGFTDYYGLGSTGQVLTVAMAVAAVLAFAAATLGLATWRSRRDEERIFGYRGRPERRGPAV